MQFTKQKPCHECPFRRKSAKGWLGGATAKEFLDQTMGDALMPCHTDKNFREIQQSTFSPDEFGKQLRDSKAQHCAGARIFFQNQFKLSRNPYILLAKTEGRLRDIGTSTEVFNWPQEFLAHHESGVLALKEKDSVKIFRKINNADG